MQLYSQHFDPTPTPSYSLAQTIESLGQRRRIGPTLERHEFSGQVDSVGKLLHTS